MYHFRAVFTSILVVSIFLGVVGVDTARAQTGPAGVGNADGTSGQPQNVLWLRGDQGALDVGGEFLQWNDQSGNGNHATPPDGSEPTLSESAISGQPAATFGGSSYFTIPDDASLDGSTGATIFIALRAEETGSRMISKRDGSGSVSYEVDTESGCSLLPPTCSTELGYTVGQDNNRISGNNGGLFDFEDEYLLAPQVIAAGSDGSAGAIYLNGEQFVAQGGGLSSVSDTDSDLAIGARVDGSMAYQGDIGEVIVFTEGLSEVRRKIIESYLARKYSADIPAGVDTVGYAHASSFDRDWAAVGESGDNSEHRIAQSGRLRVSAGSFSSGGRYVGFAHDGAGTSFGYEETEPVNGDATDLKRMAREWRVDMTGGLHTGSKQVTVSVSSSQMPSLPSGFEPVVIINGSDATFSSGSKIYTLSQNAGRYEATLTLNDGDYVTLGGVRRIVQLASDRLSDFENVGSPTSPVISLNHPYPSETGTGVQVDVAVSEAGPFGAEGPGPSGSGSDDDDASGNDYDVGSLGTVTVSAGTTQQSLSVTLHDDGVSEHSQEFDVNLSSPSNAQLGRSSLRYTILDDDNPRKLSFSNPSQVIGEGSSGGAREETFTVTLPNGFTGSTSEPCTSVGIDLNSSSTAQEGPLSYATHDFRIVNESDPGGTCPGYQERTSEQTGRIYFQGGQQTASLKLLINEDNLDDGNPETIVFDLVTPYSSALATSNTQLAVDLTDDDDGNLPTVQFSSSESTITEGETARITVSMDRTSGQPVSVPFSLYGGSTADSDDWSNLTATPLTFESGETSKDIVVETIDDAVSEIGEFARFDLGSPAGANLGSAASHTLNIADNDALLGSTGPAGVGSRGTNPLWLPADAIRASNGTSVVTWSDQSGNANDASATGTGPTYRSSGFGGQPALEFSGNRLTGSLTKIDAVSVFVVGSFSSNSGVLEVYDDVSGYRNLVDVNGSGSVRYGTDTNNSTGFFNPGLEFVTGTGRSGIYAAVHQGESVTLASDGTPSSGSLDGADRANSFVIGDDQGGGDEDRPRLSGDVAEVIVYNTALNVTQRTIVENYLAAKYGVGSLNVDVYSSSNYTQDVFGIGRAGANDYHQAAQSAGLRLDSKTGLDNDDYLLAGHNVASNSLDSSDVGGLGSHPARSDRVWFVDKTDPGNDLVVDVRFDLSEMGLSGQVTSTEDYALIRSSSSAPFSWNKVRQQADAVGNSDQITFRDVSLNDGEYYTVMTEDQTQSELDSRALVITGAEGNEAPGSVNGGAGGDAGWRMLGVPVSGASAGDLQSEVDPQLLEFWMRMMYGWDADQGVWDPLTQASDPIVNGRGYVLYLFDNEQAKFEPIDPTLTIDVNGGSDVTTGSVTVGDGSPSEDVALNTDSTWHLLANPYVQSYNLSALNLDVNADGDGVLADFQSTVQIWDPSVQSYILRNNSPLNRTVAPWQAFFVERGDFDSDAASQLTFSDAGTTTGGSFIGSKSGSESFRHVGLRATAYDASGTEIARDEAAGLVFRSGAKMGKDFYDASKLEPFATSYVALAPTSTGPNGETVLRAQRSLPYSMNKAVTVPLDVQMKNLDPSKVAISTSEWTGIPDSWDVTLVDTKATPDSSDDVEVSLGADSKYTFTPSSTKGVQQDGTISERTEEGRPRPAIRTLPHSTASQAKPKGTSNSDTTRFVLRIDPSGQPLPVELSTFDGHSDGEDVVLNWKTASESNNAGFYVEHQRLSAEDSTAQPAKDSWTREAFLDGAGTTTAPQTYQHRLSNLEYGRHAFRLRQVDSDGDVSYSKVVEAEVRLTSDHAITAPYPNPARHQATFEVAVSESQPVRVTMYDVLGRRIRTLYDDELPAQRTEKIRIGTQDLASGVYFVRVKGEGFAKTTKMTVVQ